MVFMTQFKHFDGFMPIYVNFSFWEILKMLLHRKIYIGVEFIEGTDVFITKATPLEGGDLRIKIRKTRP
jgi:hypothetical protein